ncbi:MAG: hypothetical protein V7744_11770 [Pseudomonadales bacterium]
MPMCEPTPTIKWAKDTATFTFSGARWLSSSFRIGKFTTSGTLATTHAATVVTMTGQVKAFCPQGCTANTTASGPFENMSIKGWWGGSATITHTTEVKGVFVCEQVPDGVIEYKR